MTNPIYIPYTPEPPAICPRRFKLYIDKGGKLIIKREIKTTDIWDNVNSTMSLTPSDAQSLADALTKLVKLNNF